MVTVVDQVLQLLDLLEAACRDDVAARRVLAKGGPARIIAIKYTASLFWRISIR